MSKLTETQRDLLERMNSGESICYSQDGDNAWLVPSSYRLDHVSIDEFGDLRQRKFIGSDPDFDCGEAYRFGPNDVITEAGRAALAAQGGQK